MKRVFYRYGKDFVHFYSNSLTKMNREKFITKIRKVENMKRIILFRVFVIIFKAIKPIAQWI